MFYAFFCILVLTSPFQNVHFGMFDWQHTIKWIPCCFSDTANTLDSKHFISQSLLLPLTLITASNVINHNERFEKKKPKETETNIIVLVLIFKNRTNRQGQILLFLYLVNLGPGARPQASNIKHPVFPSKRNNYILFGSDSRNSSDFAQNLYSKTTK